MGQLGGNAVVAIALVISERCSTVKVVGHALSAVDCCLQPERV